MAHSKALLSVPLLLVTVGWCTSVEASDRRATVPDRLKPPGPTVIEPAQGSDPSAARWDDRTTAPARRMGEVEVVGGDDVILDTYDSFVAQRPLLAAAENGDLYSVAYDVPVGGPETALIRRSTDDGQTWDVIGDLNSIDPDYRAFTELHVVEGSVNRLYVFYRATDAGGPEGGVLYDDLRVAYAELGVASPTWAFRTVMDPDMVGISGTSVTDDSEEFPDAWLYVVARGFGAGEGIWFSRSVDGGTTWTPPVRILTSAAGSTGSYRGALIDYGRDGRLHVVATYAARADASNARYIRSPNYGAGWSSVEVELTPLTDLIEDVVWDVVADPVGLGVTVLVNRYFWDYDDPFDSLKFTGTRLIRSLDAGASWNLADAIDVSGLDGPASALDWNAAGDVLFVMGDGIEYETGSWRAAYVEAPFEDLTSFSGPKVLGDVGSGYSPGFGLHPIRQPPVMVAYMDFYRPPVPSSSIAFDGAWRGGPGYPDYEPGFPVPIPSSGLQRRTPPALIDLDADGQLEIVFANTDGNVFVVEPDGSIASGWPVDVGRIFDDDAPVAVGDLDGDGVPSIVAGLDDGRVTALAPDGTVRPGFPVDLGTDALTYVAIGDFGAGPGRDVVALSGDVLARIDASGSTTVAPSPLDGRHVTAPAIGDVDRDGSNEIVYAYAGVDDTVVRVVRADLDTEIAARGGFSRDFSHAVSLGDLDADGDLEITLPLANGELHVLHHDLTDVAGFPHFTADRVPLSRVTIEQFVGSETPELVFVDLGGSVHVVGADNTDAPGYPVRAGDDFVERLLDAPIVTSVESGLAATVVTGSDDGDLYGFRGADGSYVEGWPRAIGDRIDVAPAAGDIDGDGRNELVFVGAESLHVFDVEVPYDASQQWWPMSGADPQRTGCANCGAVATSVEAPPLANAVRLRLASGNPVRGAAEFAFVLATSATVELQVFDLRGRRVRDLGARRLDAGEHRMIFDGRDDRGRELAPGTYLARLVVDGVVRHHDARKFVFLD